MFEFAKKGFFVGLGLASMTKDRAEAFAKEFANSAKMTEEEGRKFADYIQKESKKAQKDLKQTIDKVVEKATSKMASKKRLNELEARIARLEDAFSKCCADSDHEENAEAAEDSADS
jgi:polyhydroxyalkanoate synthesis regulator phasin